MLCHLHLGHLLELLAKSLAILTLGDSTHFQGDRASFRVVKKPICRLSPLKPSADDPSSRPVDQRESDRLGRVLGDSVVIELLRVAPRRTDPLEGGIRSFVIETGVEDDSGGMTLLL